MEDNINSNIDSQETTQENVQNTNNSLQNNEFEEDDNSALKKYIIQISREFVPLIDSMTIDERIAYINDAIQTKIDKEKEDNLKFKKNKLIFHVLIFIIIFILISPVAMFLANKAIMTTFENYKYSQENFEKLYKQRFEKDKAYMKSIEYNKRHSIKK